METSPLRLLDYDVSQMLNDEILKSKYIFNMKYYINRYNKKEYYLSHKYFEELNNSFKYMTKMRNNNIKVSFIQPIYPFYYNVHTKILNVKYSIRIYEDSKKYLNLIYI